MKKYLCVMISLILVFCFSSCNFSKIDETTVSETEEHFNTFVKHLDNLLKSHITEQYDWSSEFKYGQGKINIWSAKSDIIIQLYNCDDIEEYYIACQIEFDNADGRLNSNKEEYKILRMVLSELVCNYVTEEEFNNTITKLKNNDKIVNLVNSGKRYKAECSTEFNIVHIRYSLNYIGNDNLKYVEVMKFGGSNYNNYPKYTYK